MIDNQERKEHIENFRRHVSTKKVLDKDLTRDLYYRALVCDSRIFRAKHWLVKKNMDLFNVTMDTILNSLDTNPMNDDTVKSTLVQILKFHLDNHSGQPSSAEVLEKIEKELNTVLDGIFEHRLAYVKVHNTSESSDKFKVSIHFT